MKPALSAEEWERALSRPPGVILHDNQTADRHSVAAACLYGQPFGFSQNDVAMLRAFASPPDLPPFAPLLDLAARIEALLPPRATLSDDHFHAIPAEGP